MLPPKKTIKPTATRKIMIFLAMFIIIVIIINAFNSISTLVSSHKENFIQVPKITNTYIEVLSAPSQSYIKPSYTYYKRHKPPIATYLNTKTGGNLIIYKIDTAVNIPDLKNNIKLDSLNFPETNNVVYDGMAKSNEWLLLDREEPKARYNKIYLSIEGTDISRTVYSDSLIYYSCLLKKLYIQSDQNNKAELFIKGKKIFSDSKPVEFAFKIKNNNIYFIFNGDLNKRKPANSMDSLYEIAK